jgi:Ca2+-binding RTX toxin-like protein
VIEALEDRRLLSAVIDATNTLLIKGTARADNIVIGANSTSVGVTINGVTQHFDKGSFSAITVKAGGGNDTVSIDETYGSLGMGVRVEGGGGGDQIHGSTLDDTLLGGDGLDYIFGGAGNDSISGQGGKNYLWGQAGNDTVTGGGTEDAIYGGDGDDALYGGAGYDVLEGGSGTDITNGGPGPSTIDNPNAAGAHPMMVKGTSTSGTGVASPDRFIASPFGLMAEDIRDSYQFGPLSDPTFTNRGAGQGIAIIDAYDTPTALNDVNVFSTANGLPLMDGTSLQVVYATGIRPSTDPTVEGDGIGVTQLNEWSTEANIDVQWAHAIAPEATIYLVEAASNLNSDLVDAIEVASRLLKKNHGGGVVSMSFGADETLAQSPLYERVFNKPGFTSVTYVASSGDTAGELSYPATSPRVIAVGGSVLQFSNGVQLPDTAWSGSGGGESTVFALPPYQLNLDYIDQDGLVHNTATDNVGFRMVPDVAYNAGTGVSTFTSFLTIDFDILDDITPYPYGLDSGWGSWGGTSVGAPQWAALFALGNQQRVAAGKSLIGNNAHNLIYTMGAHQSQGSFFQDVVSDDPFDIPNVNPPGPGFDKATGFGRPHGAIVADGLAANDALVNGSVAGQFTSIYNEAPNKYPGGGVQLWAQYQGTVFGTVGTNAVSLTFNVTRPFGTTNTFTFTAVVPRLSRTRFSGIVENVSIPGALTTTLFNLKIDGTIAVSGGGAYAVSGTFEGLDPLTGFPPHTGSQETFTGRFFR